MASILAAGEFGENSQERRIFASLFQLILSGTQATPEQRLKVLKALLVSPDAKLRGLGLVGLRSTLNAGQFGSEGKFVFGAHSRAHGYWPPTQGDVRTWYLETLKLVEALATSDGPRLLER